MLRNDSCSIDGLYFDKKSLLERCLEIYWFNFSFNLLIGVLMILCANPNMLSVSFIRWIVLSMIIANIIILIRIYNVSLKINRIFNNGKILKTNVLREKTSFRLSHSLLVGSYCIYSMYFDGLNGKSFPFMFKGHIDRPVDLTKPFKQGEDWRDLKTINVLVNADDYNDYFVLFREELNIDTSRRSYGPVNLIDYILWYGGIIFFIWLTR
ncbi:MAG: hypothetical protein IJP29_07290 [Lachnospiraceae bacterium]|nr:hypothetical protein [Lachnospiraceae bacterium]